MNLDKATQNQFKSEISKEFVAFVKKGTEILEGRVGERNTQLHPFKEVGPRG